MKNMLTWTMRTRVVTAKTFYIIPGWKETSRRRPYQKLAKLATQKGYHVIFKNVNWSKKLSEQFFTVEKDAVVFGFSLGALLARLVIQDEPCKQLILASMTQLECFDGGEMEKALVDLLGAIFVKDIKKNLKPKHLAVKQTILYGDKEGEKADILVRNTGHELNDSYITEIGKLL